MESSSHITGDAGDEGCNSSESGWTMYLASPMHGDDSGGGKGSGSEGSSVDDGYGYISNRRSGKKAYDDYADADDDDSLASDASTGPAKVTVPSLPEGGKEEDEGHGKSSGGRGKEEEQEEDEVRTKFSTSPRKKAGKAEKGGEGKSLRRGHSKRGSSSRTSFFW
ncbi:protein SOB FIVE-LIKE 4-like [Phragmites australis]|uniref:protein SOB FIVE-LIKE 4-like n=1 Tax=Phragmites australis TaxID=29695 RepID=UPI002D774E14|nr:protein SOB FIVE-LIKE 4-like [Phragmites australis]